MKFLATYRVLIIMILLILIIWGFAPAIISAWATACKDCSSLGQFGDMFGVINVLFTGLTMSFLVYSIKQASDQRKAAYYQRFEDYMLKLIDLHIKHFQELKPSFEKFEADNVVLINATPNTSTYKDEYRKHFEKKHVIKNYINYLHTFEFIVETILKKKAESTREKYFKLYFAQMHINEKRFLLYQFNLGTTKPGKWTEDNWKEIKKFLYEDFNRDYLAPELQDYSFEGLDEEPNKQYKSLG